MAKKREPAQEKTPYVYVPPVLHTVKVAGCWCHTCQPGWAK